jgi:Ca2+-binding RTX toxin-like protein
MAVSQVEQWLLEIVNRMRLDPLGTARKYAIDLNEGLEPGTISATAKQPLAMSAILDATTEFHGAWILENNSFGSIGYLGSNPGDRMAYAGFNDGAPFDWSEILGWRDFPLNAGVMEQGLAYDILRDMFLNPQIRRALLAEDYNEVGLNYVGGQIASFDRKAYLITQDMGDSDAVFITGGIFSSNNLGITWSSMPIGRAGVEVRNGTDSMITDASGGYRLLAEAGSQSVRLGDAHFGVTITDENIKLDLIGNRGLLSSHSVTVYSGVAYATLIGVADATLAAGDNAGEIWLEGNIGNNRLSGNRWNNILDGREGDDFMQGGGGNDLYYVDSAGDRVNEFANGGFDRIETTVSFKLGTNSQVERIETRHEIFKDPIDLSGNRFAQELIGNHGNNRLDGVGGGDRLVGSLGDDTYVIRDLRDEIVEYAGEGQDTVKADISFALAADDHIEFLETRLPSAGHRIHLTGNDFAQKITGNEGSNILSGMGGDDRLIGGAGGDTLIGGLGSDSLHGGSGLDRYVFTSVEDSPTGAGRDSIYGWQPFDTIDLSAIDANQDQAGRQNLTFVGEVAEGAAIGIGEVAYYHRITSTYVIANTSGDGQSEFEVRISGLHDLVANDFLLV